MPHAPDHKAVVDSIIDHDLDVRRLVDQVVKGGADTAAKQLIAVARKVFDLRLSGKLGAEAAKKLLRDARKAVLLAQFSKHAGEIQQVVDRNMDAQISAVRKLGRPLRELAPVRKADVLARELEKQAPAKGEGDASA